MVLLKRLLRSLFSPNQSNGRLVFTAIALFIIAAYLLRLVFWIMPVNLPLLTDPFLQLPTRESVNVVWFTEFEGDRHVVEYGPDLTQIVDATTTKLSRMREDQKSRVGNQREDGQVYQQPTERDIWRHEATVTGLTEGDRLPYRVVSTNGRHQGHSEQFTLSPLPATGQPLSILLTSDHQQMPMTAANLQKVEETVGQVDAVFLAGDLVNIPDRASEWFDDNEGGAFFPCLQGRASYKLDKDGKTTTYRGGSLIQHAPLFPATGNHEVMGRFDPETELNDQFNDPYPQSAAAKLYAEQISEINPDHDPATLNQWIRNHSFNTISYDEIFSLPDTSPGGESYYAVTFGDIRLISLYATNIWRRPSLEPGVRGKYRERDEDLAAPENWGYGQHIFEPITKGSSQYNWLVAELQSEEFQQAQYKIVMFHHPPHSLGDNIVPAYTDPVQIITEDDQGQIQSIRYEYPLESDYLIRDVQPLLESAGVQLVLYGHSHLWNRFTSAAGTHFLETSNVGNTYGAYWGNKRRHVPIGFDETYPPTGDPNGLEPVVPTIAPLTDADGNPQPFIASNDISVFSILDTATGTVSSYRFDTREPDAPVIKFDEFSLIEEIVAVIDFDV